MKCTFFFFVFIVIAFISIQCHPEENIHSIIAEIEDHYVPDRREGIFSITADRSGSNLVLRGETDHPEAHGALISTLENEGYQIADSIINLPLKKDSQ